MFPSETLFRVLLTPDQSLSLCKVSWPVAPCHANMIRVSGCPFTCLATHLLDSLPIVDSWSSHRLVAQSHNVQYVWPVHCPEVQPGHCASVQTCVVCIRSDAHEHSRVLSPSMFSLSLAAALSQCLLSGLYAIPSSCQTIFLVQYNQRLAEIAGCSHHDVLRFEMLVHDALHPLQLVLEST